MCRPNAWLQRYVEPPGYGSHRGAGVWPWNHHRSCPKSPGFIVFHSEKTQKKLLKKKSGKSQHHFNKCSTSKSFPKTKIPSWWQKVSQNASTPSERSAPKSRSVVATSCTFRKASWKLGPEIPCPPRQPPHVRTPSPPWHHKAKNCLVAAIWTDRAMAVMQAPSSRFSASIGSSSCPSEPSSLRNFCLTGHNKKCSSGQWFAKGQWYNIGLTKDPIGWRERRICRSST